MLIVGFQSPGSLGRKLVDGAKISEDIWRRDSGARVDTARWVASARTRTRKVYWSGLVL